MQPSTLEAFLASPVGRYIAADTFVYGCIDRDLFVTLLLDRPAETDMRELMALYEAELRRAPHESLLDCARMTGVDAAAYSVYADYLARRRFERKRVIRKQAIVRPSGMAGATIVGYGKLAPAKHPARIFATAAAALVWLGRDADDAGVPQLHAAAEIDPLLDRLRAQLDAVPRASITASARRLGVSPRSLQRHLNAHATTYRREVARAQIVRAKRLLAETDLKLAVVASEVGCASSQHFSDLFRRMTCTSPRVWRMRQRRDDP